jgi:hypothetical protein
MIEKLTATLCTFTVFSGGLHGFLSPLLVRPTKWRNALWLAGLIWFGGGFPNHLSRMRLSSASRTLWRHARHLANARVAEQHVRGLLIESCCPVEAVVLLELQQRPLCFRARDAIERAMVEPDRVKLYLHPSDVVFREISGIDPVV